MNAGELRERVTLLRLVRTGDAYAWREQGTLWAKAEQKDKRNLFSGIGLGAGTAAFTTRVRPLTLHDALLWRGRHCFLTGIKEVDRAYLEIAAALVEPVTCALYRAAGGLDAYKRPVRGEPERVLTFPGVLTEKYFGFTQGEPMAQVEQTVVLVTPKEIGLRESDLVEASGVRYAVQICHALDPYKNEYELYRKADV